MCDIRNQLFEFVSGRLVHCCALRAQDQSWCREMVKIPAFARLGRGGHSGTWIAKKGPDGGRLMRPKFAWRTGEAIGSLICAIGVLGALVAFDDRVRERLSLEMSREGLATWGERASGVATVILAVARDQSIEHAPLLVFSVVAVVLVLFMLRT